jgi:hypothetical protein
LATPFVEVHQADFGYRPFFVRATLHCVMMCLLLLALQGFSLDPIPIYPEPYSSPAHSSPAHYAWLAIILVGYAFLFWWPWRFVRRAAARQDRIQSLSAATKIIASAERLLIVRAIDDEASLVLAIGTVLNYVTAIFIVTGMMLVGVITAVSLFAALFFPTLFPSPLAFVEMLFLRVTAAWIIVTFMLFGTLMLSRAVHGRELAASPMELQVNTQSTPDAFGQLTIVTLVQSTLARSLRHSIYDHKDCAKTIVEWVRSQLVPCCPIGDRGFSGQEGGTDFCRPASQP